MTTANNSTESEFTLGIIEGFFGQSWSWDDRRWYAGFMRETGFTTYCYAPKSDVWLRRRWAEPMPDHHLDKLAQTGQIFREAKLCFGIGLSPFELYRDFSADARKQLLAKLTQLDKATPELLCLLFDDMPGDCPDLAKRQSDIMDFIRQHSTATRFVLCPTYYSDDPQLAKHFGPIPNGYLEELGQLLAEDIDIFWTGPKVVSHHYPREHLRSVTDRMGRKPLIWDNYPVNDSQSMVDFLHLRPAERSPDLYAGNCRGLLANPMNQARLSTIPLAGLAAQYGTGHASFKELCQARCGDALGKLLAHDLVLFQERGLKSLKVDEKRNLLERYDEYRSHPCAREIIDWLDGRYGFDPSCLTQ